MCLLNNQQCRLNEHLNNKSLNRLLSVLKSPTDNFNLIWKKCNLNQSYILRCNVSTNSKLCEANVDVSDLIAVWRVCFWIKSTVIFNFFAKLSLSKQSKKKCQYLWKPLQDKILTYTMLSNKTIYIDHS